MRLLKLQLVVDNALEENGAREMVAAHGFLAQQTKATEADKLFALSESHDQKLLVRELATRSHMANDKILRDLAYENMLRSGELIDALKFDEVLKVPLISCTRVIC
jgi:hypothetical protein